MERRRTVGEYRLIDLLLFSLMVFFGEMVIVKAAMLFPAGTHYIPIEMEGTDQIKVLELGGNPYVFSLVPLITSIVMMRWGFWAAIHAVLGGLALCIGTGATVQQYIVYCAGNLLGLGAMGMIRLYGKAGVRETSMRTILFGLLTALLMQLGRAVISLAVGGTVEDMAGFFLADVLTLLFTAVAMWIVRRLDGVFEDQINYLLRISKEREEERKSSDEG